MIQNRRHPSSTVLTLPAYYRPLTEGVYSPLHRRTVYLTERQVALITRVQAGHVGNQRALAALSGYTLSGLTRALATLRKLGILGVLTRRGRHGWTRLKLQAGVRLLRNVRYVVDVLRRRGEADVYVADISTRGGLAAAEGALERVVERPPGTSRYLRIDPY